MQRPSRPQDLLLFITSPKPRSTLQKLYSKVTGTRLRRSRPHPQQKCLICFSHISSKKHSRFFVFWGSRQRTKKLKEGPKTSLGLKPQLLQIPFYCFSRGMRKSCETLLLFWVASFCTHASKVCYPYFVNKLSLHNIWYYRYTVDTLHNPKEAQKYWKSIDRSEYYHRRHCKYQ